MTPHRQAVQNVPTEWSYNSGRAYADPFNEVELDVVVTGPSGAELRVPAFWAGDQEWRVRYAAPQPGTYRYRTACSDEDNADLHGQEGVLEVSAYDGDNPLFRHGPLRVSADQRHLEHLDGTPFFWLGDTWWMGLCRRLAWPQDFQLLTADRKAKGFTVIQFVAGLYPDMPAFDERGANEAGYPWEQDYQRINPAYFDMADLRVRWLVNSALVPCILGCWGFYLGWMGVDRMKVHWRYLIARYGAYPVLWCLAGEGIMPWYLSEDKDGDRAFQRSGWTEVARYVRGADAYHRPITIHPTDCARDQVEDQSVLDFEMLQTGHAGHESIPNTVRQMRRAVARAPRMPVVNGEVCYEGILEGSRQEIQRFMFWSCMLCGAAGHTYGAQGIWCVNTRRQPFGPSPWGASWGDTPWEDAYRLPGSSHVGVGKRLLERYEWWRFEAHQDWIEPSASDNDYLKPYGAGIPGQVRVFYFPRPILPWSGRPFVIRQLETGVNYEAVFFDPKNGREYRAGRVEANAGGDWEVPLPPIGQDWVLVLERTKP